MSETVTAYPLCWPYGKPRTQYRERSRFDVTPGRALDAVRDEVARQTGTVRWGDAQLIVSTNLELRRDGFPMANRRAVIDTGVAVYFQFKGKSRCIPCDKWDAVHDNMQAIAKTIDALRGISRWGTEGMLEAAYDGYIALPPPDAKKTWWQVFGVYAHTPTNEVIAAYRVARGRAHPDRGGSTESFNDSEVAYQEFCKERGL